MTPDPDSPARRIDAKIAALADWRAGILCTGETYKAKVKLTFPHGAALPDPQGLFNASLEGKVRRAIDFDAASDIDEAAFQALVRSAIRHNRARAK